MFILRGIEWEKSFFGDIGKTDTSNFVTKGKEYNSGIVYTKTQVGQSEWCWWCKKTLSTKGNYALPIKKVFLKNKKPQEEGNFCTRSCAKAYALDNIPKSREKYSKALGLLESQHRSEGGKSRIRTAPHWKLLSGFSGPMTREQYEAEIGVVEYDLNPSFKPKEQNPTSCYFREY